MKKILLLVVIAVHLCGCSHNLPSLQHETKLIIEKTPLFKTEVVFKNPESIVFDPITRQIFVSNVNGHPFEKDGNGFISKVAINGDVRDLHWITGLNAPKGMTLIGDFLYVADIDRLAVIDITNNYMTFYPAPNAIFLNDITHDADGIVYISDFLNDTIYTFQNDEISVWLKSKKLQSPNGLYVKGDTLYIGNWGQMVDGFKTKFTGDLIGVHLKTKEITTLAKQVGNLDGVAGYGNYFILTDFIAGNLLVLGANGEQQHQQYLGQGSADLCVLPEDWELLVVPMMNDNFLYGFTITIPE